MVTECTMDDILVIDSETTGLFERRNVVLQLGVVDGHGNIMIDAMYRPAHIQSWGGASRIHGIYPDDVRELQTFIQNKMNGRQRLESLMSDAKCIIGYNTSFDLTMLYNSGLRYEIPDTVQIIDVMYDFAPVYGEYPDWLCGEAKWQKLCVAASYCNYKGNGAWHNAIADCKATLHVFRCMYQAGYYRNILDILDFPYNIQYSEISRQNAIRRAKFSNARVKS